MAHREIAGQTSLKFDQPCANGSMLGKAILLVTVISFSFSVK